MGGEAGIFLGADAFKAAGSGGIHTRIDEQHALAALQVKRILNLKLEVGQALHLTPFGVTRDQGFHMLDKERPEGVVAPAGISPAEDQKWSDHELALKSRYW